MCGRFVLTSPAEVVAELLGLADVPELTSRLDIRPTQAVAAAIQEGPTEMRQFRWLKWGLVPFWAKDPKIGSRMFNARGETVSSKPSFRSAFKRRRCLIPADGFYEWQKRERGKQPFLIRMANQELFAFAGLWEHWSDEQGQEINSCTVITTTPNELIAPIHDRMPVILTQADYAKWVDPTESELDGLQSILRPFPAKSMVAEPVDSARFRQRSA